MSTPAAQVPAQVAEAEKKNPQLQLAHFKQAENLRNIWCVQADRSVTQEQFLDETYWAHVAKMLRAGDRIEIMTEDNAYFAELMVLATGRLYAQVELMRYVEFDRPSPQASAEAEFKIDWGGSISKYRILRGNDVLSEGHETEKAALRWRDSHIDALKR